MAAHVYFQDLREPNLESVKSVDVAQVDVLGDCVIRCVVGFLFLLIGL